MQNTGILELVELYGRVHLGIGGRLHDGKSAFRALEAPPLWQEMIRSRLAPRPEDPEQPGDVLLLRSKSMQDASSVVAGTGPGAGPGMGLKTVGGKQRRGSHGIGHLSAAEARSSKLSDWGHFLPDFTNLQLHLSLKMCLFSVGEPSGELSSHESSPSPFSVSFDFLFLTMNR